MKDRITMITECLTASLQPEMCEVTDDSAAHIGHAGAMNGAGHYRIRIVAACFNGLSAVERHRRIYSALKQWIGPEIHALQIGAYTPTEWHQFDKTS